MTRNPAWFRENAGWKVMTETSWGVCVTDSKRRVRTRTHGGMAGVGGAPAAPMPIKSRCHQQLNRVVNQENHCPCRFRAVSTALHGTSRVRSHLPQAYYMKLRSTMVSNPTLSAKLLIINNLMAVPRSPASCCLLSISFSISDIQVHSPEVRADKPATMSATAEG